MESVNVLGSTSPVNTVLKSRPDGIPGLSSLSLPELSTKTSHCRDLFSLGPATVLSPVTNLALDMNNLAVLGRYYYKFNVFLFSASTRLKLNVTAAAGFFASHGQKPNNSYLECKVWYSVYITDFPVHVFPHTANVIHRKGESMHLLRRFPPLPLTSHLMLVSFP